MIRASRWCTWLALCTTANLALAADRPVPIPKPNLDQVESAIAEQLRELRTALDELLGAEPLNQAAVLAAYTDLGQSYLAYSMLEPGVAALENAMLLDPGDYRWPYLVGRVAQENGKFERAAEHLARVLELEADYLPALIRLGDLELSRQVLEAARHWYERALEVAPGSPAANYGLGQIAAREDRPTDAVKHFEEVLSIQPTANAVNYPLGLAFRDLGDMDKAREHLSQRGEVGVKSYDPLADALAERVVGAGLFVSRGNVAFTEGNYDLAIQAYSKAINANPTHEVAIQGLASSYARAGRLDEAISVYESILERKPDDAVNLYNLGTLLSDAGRRAGAMSALERALDVAPDFDDALFNLALMHEQAGDWQEAFGLYERLVTANPEDLEARVHRASSLAGLGRLTEARQEFAAVIELDPRLGTAYLAAAKAEERAGDSSGARAAYETAIQRAGTARTRAQAAFELGSLLASSDADAAIVAFQTAIANAPGVAAPRFALARLLGQAQRFDDAARQFDSGLQLEPGALEAHIGRAIALLLADREAAALAALDQSLAAVGDVTTLAHLRARILATGADAEARNGAMALESAQSIMQREPSLDHAETVAMALAEVGRFDDATTLQEQVLQRAQAGGLTALLPTIERRLQAYRAGEPVRTPWKP